MMARLIRSFRRLFEPITERPCPICGEGGADDPGWWSDHYKAWVHPLCVPAYIRAQTWELIQRWLDTGEVPSPGKHLASQIEDSPARPGRPSN